MDSGVIVAIITGVFSVLAILLTNIASNKAIAAKLDKQHAVFEAIVTEKIGTLQKTVEKHNQVIDRTYKLEQKTAVIEQKLNDMERHK